MMHIIASTDGKTQRLLDPIKRYGDIMKAVGYIRVSTEDQAREGISLEHQEVKVKAHAAINDLALVEIIRDEGASGKNLEREGVKRLLKLVESGKVEAVIVYKLDRLSRKTLDTLGYQERYGEVLLHHNLGPSSDGKRFDSGAYQRRTKSQEEKWRVDWPCSFWLQGAE
jgi:predicted site-specific integrase-resolvase